MLADDLSYYVGMPETGGLYPEVVVSLGVKDPAAFEKAAQKAVDGLLQTAGRDEHVTGRQRVVEWHGKRLYMVELQGVRRRDMVPFTPTWAILDGRWVITLVPHAMKELILRTEQGGKGLADQEDVVSILRGAPEKATSLGYVDLQALLTLLYDTAVPLLQTAAKPNLLQAPVRLDWSMLPPTRAVRPYLRSMGTHSHVEGDAFVAQVDSPMGYMLPLAMAAGASMVAMKARSRRSAGSTCVVMAWRPSACSWACSAAGMSRPSRVNGRQNGLLSGCAFSCASICCSTRASTFCDGTQRAARARAWRRLWMSSSMRRG
jgi:hypothetical protein